MPGWRIPQSGVPVLLAAGWGFCTFFPVGVAYSFMLLLLLTLCLSGGMRERLAQLRTSVFLWPMGAFLAWTLLALAVGPWFPDSSTRLFHIVRVLLLLLMGMLLRPVEAKAGLAGFLAGAILAAIIVTVHRVWELPRWTIWDSLLMSRNNFSSGNMIMMAIAAGLFFLLGLRNNRLWLGRWPAWGAALALAVTVVEHSLSRNAQALLPALLLVVVWCRFRAWRQLVSAVALIAVLALGAWQGSPATRERFSAIVAQAERVATMADYTTGVGERWLMFQTAWQGMLEHPMFGTGLGSWLPGWRVIALETGQSLSPERLDRHIEINNPHNDFLLTGMESGIAGLVIMAWLLGLFVRTGWRQRSLEGDLTVVLGSGLILTALINAPLRDAALGMTLLWLLGASVAMHKGATHA